MGTALVLDLRARILARPGGPAACSPATSAGSRSSPGAGSYVGLTTDPWKWFTSLILPWLRARGRQRRVYARLMRGSLIETMGEDYIRTARAKGLPERARDPPGRALRDQPDRHDARRSTSACCWAARSSSRPCSTSPASGGSHYDAIAHVGLPDRSRARCCSPRSSSSSPTSSWTSPTRTSIRGCATHERRQSRCCASRTCASSSPPRRGRARRRRHHLRGRPRPARSGIVGESGSGKTVSSLTMIGLTRAPGRARLRARSCSRAATWWRSPKSELRAIRGNEIAMIFQDPLSSLHPVLHGRRPAGRGDPRAPRRAQGEGARARDRAARPRRHPRPRAARRRVPARVLRRHAPARDDRDGARQRPEAADRRRADDRARRDRAGADPRR